jgi:GT2 family glycosyltransferase/glycosyltransferase involved in cell wall biosynthesis
MRFLDKLRAFRGEVLLGSLWLMRALPGRFGLRGPYRLLLARLVKSTRLFDSSHYLEVHADIAGCGISPLRHYIAHGDREGRSPMPLFEPHYYRSKAHSRTKHVNSLLHYYHVGRHRRISPSPWFDVQHYLAQNKDVLRAGLEPIDHYLKHGGLEGRSPNPQFDSAWYSRAHPEVAELRLNPLLHYIRLGRGQQLPARRVNAGLDKQSAHPAAPLRTGMHKLESLEPLAFEKPPCIDVIVPVYKDRVLTLNCLYSILTARYPTPFELIVIDDASPDQRLTRDLQQLAARGLFTLLHNESNLGFVATVNRGMALHPERDIVILNSDTEVYNNWLERLHAAAYRHETTASVTPLSSNATICSYPRFLHDNPFPLELSYAELDQEAAIVNERHEVEAPTGVGFCMYLKREAIKQIGQFDEVAFGKGYGEENDWCQRAIQNGWRNVIATDIFVRHIGSASFQGEKNERLVHALRTLQRKHPNYLAQVKAFVDADPLRSARRRLDWARLQRQVRPENILLVCHNRGGGSERHMQEDAVRLLEENKGVFILRAVRGKPDRVRIQHPASKQLLNLQNFKLSEIGALAKALQPLAISCVHSHGLVDFTANAPRQIMRLAQTLNAGLQVDIHDYKAICPRINLVDDEGMYCGEPDEAGCDACLTTLGNDFGIEQIRPWRSQHYEVLKFAEEIWVPSHDVAQRLKRYYPDLAFAIAPHEDLRITCFQTPVPAPDEPLHVVVIGSIGKMKGFNVVLSCAQDAKKRNLPLRFTVLGHSINDRKLRKAGVHVTGMYQENQAQEQLAVLKPHVVLLPSTWPETYSYTLTIALKAGLPVFAFDIGAIAERLKALKLAQHLQPLEKAGRPRQLNQQFLAYRANVVERSVA